MEIWDSYCPSCFSEKTDGKQHCQFCGYDEGESRSPAALPLRTILNDQYVVGRVLGNPGGFGIMYLCWDTVVSQQRKTGAVDGCLCMRGDIVLSGGGTNPTNSGGSYRRG
jgi:hypothetical protein